MQSAIYFRMFRHPRRDLGETRRHGTHLQYGEQQGEQSRGSRRPESAGESQGDEYRREQGLVVDEGRRSEHRGGLVASPLRQDGPGN